MSHISKKGKPFKTALIQASGLMGMALALAVAVPESTSAQALVLAGCATHGEVAEKLERRFSEAPAAIGLAGNGSVIELFSTADGATWTLVLTMPDGTSCMVAAGQGWESITPIALGPEA
jgi:hypothetical protein